MSSTRSSTSRLRLLCQSRVARTTMIAATTTASCGMSRSSVRGTSSSTAGRHHLSTSSTLSGPPMMLSRPMGIRTVILGLRTARRSSTCTATSGRLLGRAFEDSADPGPVVYFPKDDPGLADGEETNREAALRIARRRRSGSSIALPSDVYEDFQNRTLNIPKWRIEYPKRETNFADIQQFMGYLEALKFRALSTSEGSLTEGSGASSSRMVVENMSSQRDSSQAVLMDQVVSIIMDQMVRPAMAINMPWYEGRLEMKTLGFGQDDEDVVRQIFQLAGQNDLSNFGVDVRRLAESRGLPMLDPEEMARRQREDAKKAQQQPTPEVQPNRTQGRRALVTQTGFGEAIYHQVNDPIALSDDGDFVASLPKSPAWESRHVVDAARALRSRAAHFADQAGRDLCIYARKRELDVAAEALAEDHVAEVSRAARALASSWAPRASVVDELSEAARHALGRAYDRVAFDHARALRSKPSPTSPEAASWLDERRDIVVSTLVAGLRDCMADLVAEGADRGSTPKQSVDEGRERLSSAMESMVATLARDEVARVYRKATVDAGIAAGVSKCQVEIPGGYGAIVDLSGVDDESVRLLPSAPDDLEIRRVELDGQYRARYDEGAHVVLLASDIEEHEEVEYMTAIGDVLAKPS